MLVGKHRDAVAQFVQCIEVVGDQQHRETVLLAQALDQPDKALRAVRIEARGGLVENQQVGRQGQSAGKGHAFDHSTGKFRRQQFAVARLEFHLGKLGVDDAADLVVVQPAALAQREGDVLVHAERRIQGAALEQHAHAPARIAHLLRARILPGDAEHAHQACRRPLQAEDHAQQLRLAAARAADQRHHFVAAHLEFEILVQDDAGAHRIDQALHLDDVVAIAAHGFRHLRARCAA